MFAEDLPESVIKRLSIRVKELNGINLGQGIPSFPTPEHIIAAAREALNEKNIGVYPNYLGTLELREAIVGKLNREYELTLKATENVLVTVGAMEATASAILSLIDSGDRVGVITPDYCNHFPQIMLARGKVVEIPLLEQKTWILDLSKVATEAKKGLKLLILTNPNNPTGAVFDKEQMRQLVELADKYGFWILADETYAFLDYAQKFSSLLEFWNRSERLLVVRTFSKEYAMTGWRVGYIIANPEVIKVIAKTHDALVGCAPKISQKAAVAAITGPQKIVAEFVKTLRKRRDLACELLDQLNTYVSYAKPEGAYYIFPKYKVEKKSLDLTEQILAQAHVAVVPGAVFGQAGEGHIRISFAVEDEVLIQGIKRLEKFFEQIYTGISFLKG